MSFGRGAWAEVARAKEDGLEIELVTVATLLNDPPEADAPPDKKLPDLTRQLLERSREARFRSTPREPPPKRTIEELEASAKATVG